MTQKLQDEMFEAMLRCALQDHREEALLTEEELRAQGAELHQFSPQFEQKMEKLIRTTSKKEQRKQRGKRGWRIAAMFTTVWVGLKNLFDLDD